MKQRGIIHFFIVGSLAVLVWLTAAGAARAASRSEENNWRTAVRLRDAESWSLAEQKFSSFTNDYPASEYFAQAVLSQAEARFQLAKARQGPWSYKDAINLLKQQLPRAGTLADEYLYRMGAWQQADGAYTDAAATYDQLARGYEARRAEALVREADCYRLASNPARIVQLLSAPDGLFQSVVKTNAADAWVARGLFELAETDLALKDCDGAAAALQQVPVRPVSSELEWKRQILTVRTSLEARKAEEALANSSNLLASANGLLSRTTPSRLLLGEINRQLDQIPEALSNYEAVLNTETNVDLAGDALLGIVTLNLQSSNTDKAAQALQDFVNKHPDERASGRYFLLLGTIGLYQQAQSQQSNAAAATTTNFLPMAETNLLMVTQNTNSPWRGLAELYLGWCQWMEGRTAESAAAFSNAVDLLPAGEDRAVALYKLGDAQYAGKNFDGAVQSYNAVLQEGSGIAAATNNLFELALYQIVRVSTDKQNPRPDEAAATAAMSKIRSLYPQSLLSEQGSLLLLLHYYREQKAGDAGSVFKSFIEQWPNSPLRPEVELLVARTFERVNDWTNALAQYSKWIDAYPTNASLPSAKFSRAQARWMLGDETNAFNEFTNFVAEYPSNELAPLAVEWVGRFYFNWKDYRSAEDSFQKAYKMAKATDKELAFEALQMAGISAFCRPNYLDAANYFNELAVDTNYPPAWRSKALFAFADARRLQFTPTNFTPVAEAAEILVTIGNNNPDSEIGAEAWGDVGSCYLLLSKLNPTNYLAASNAFARVINSPYANLEKRCLAEFGTVNALEGLAHSNLPGSEDRQANLKAALGHCLTVFSGDNLRPPAENDRDMLYVGKLGREAVQIMEELGDWKGAMGMCRSLKKQLPLPADQSWLDAHILEAQKYVPES